MTSVWQPEQTCWARCDLPTPQHWDWGELVTPREAERCYPGSMNAKLPEGVEEVLVGLDGEEMSRYRPELFDFYDFGTSPRESLEESAENDAEFEGLLEQIEDPKQT